MASWPHDIADTPVARLAWQLQHRYNFELAPHLAVEELALVIASEAGLKPPVSFDAARLFLTELGLVVRQRSIDRCALT